MISIVWIFDLAVDILFTYSDIGLARLTFDSPIKIISIVWIFDLPMDISFSYLDIDHAMWTFDFPIDIWITY